jgi:UDP-N-acetyl-D-glucosamine dehydrogenase
LTLHPRSYQYAALRGCKVQDALNDHEKAIKGRRYWYWEHAYKPDIDDLRESPAIDVIRCWSKKGAQISYYDPYIPVIKEDGWEIKSIAVMMAGVRKLIVSSSSPP